MLYSSFANNRAAKDGLQFYCRVCVNTGVYKDPARNSRKKVPHGTRNIVAGGTQACTDCGQMKPVTEFRKRGDRSNAVTSQCRKCWTDWRRDHRAGTGAQKYAEQTHRARLYRHRGMTEKLFDSMFVEQEGRCAICTSAMTVQRIESKMDVAHIDHDHTCCPKYACLECVRELLCARCNAVIGFAREDVTVLFSAIAYLIKHKVVTLDDLNAQDSPGVFSVIRE